MYSLYNKHPHRRHGGHGGRVMGGQPYTKAEAVPPAHSSVANPYSPELWNRIGRVPTNIPQNPMEKKEESPTN